MPTYLWHAKVNGPNDTIQRIWGTIYVEHKEQVAAAMFHQVERDFKYEAEDVLDWDVELIDGD